MSYCVGILTKFGLAFMSDTRTNAGLDDLSQFKKLFTWGRSDDRLFTLLSAGNLATTQAVVSEICLLYTSPSPRDATLSRMPSSA